jgi:putative ABC transport system permease protein
MASLAVSNLLHDKVRFAVTVVGVVFAVVLVAVQIGLFIGFATTTSNVIDHSQADLWIVSQNVDHLEVGVPMAESKLYQALSTPGVLSAQKHIVQFVDWRCPSGAIERVELVGFEPHGDMGGPWNAEAGAVAALNAPDAMVIDRLYLDKLGIVDVGQTVEIRQRRARVVGFTKGIRTFTTAPVVFTSFKNALNYTGLAADRTTYILVKAIDGYDVQRLRRDLKAQLTGVDVYTTGEFSRRTRVYWMFGTGAGITIILAAVLGFIVGVVIVAQTIYAATIDHLREYGTLKAIGASNLYLNWVIVKQSLISGAIGYTVGIAIGYLAVQLSRESQVQIVVPWPIGVALLALTLAMCAAASVVSIHKVTRIDPAVVFRN